MSIKPDYSWPTIEDYEKCSGFSVNDAFRVGWDMARTTDTMLGIKSDTPPSQPAVPQGWKPVGYLQSDEFDGHTFEPIDGEWPFDELLFSLAPAPSQEPVNRPQNCGTSYCSCIECVCEPEPVTLTDEEICECFGIDGADDWVFKGAHAIIAALREKG